MTRPTKTRIVKDRHWKGNPQWTVMWSYRRWWPRWTSVGVFHSRTAAVMAERELIERLKL